MRVNTSSSWCGVDGVFSIDGYIADVPAISTLCYDPSALLMEDKAHSVGVPGRNGFGVQEHFGLAPDAIDVKVGTLSKALADIGGFVVGRSELIDFLRHSARGYMFFDAIPSACVAASIAALDVLRDEPERVNRLQENAVWWKTSLDEAGFNTLKSCSPIVPIVLPDEKTTLEFSSRCRQRGVFTVPVIYPAVPVNAPRLRTCVSSEHTSEQLIFALTVLVEVAKELEVLGSSLTTSDR